jgi:signal transduction histidine kinase
MADLELIEQVVINLIQNSIEAMSTKTDRVIEIVAKKNQQENVRISVLDNGTGITPEVIEKIFLPFYSTKTSNSGIGLSLSQQIMMLHNGRLEINTDKADGAEFVMVF